MFINGLSLMLIEGCQKPKIRLNYHHKTTNDKLLTHQHHQELTTAYCDLTINNSHCLGDKGKKYGVWVYNNAVFSLVNEMNDGLLFF